MSIDYKKIVQLSEKNADLIFQKEYKQVVGRLERSIQDAAERGQFSTTITISPDLRQQIFYKLQNDYPEFRFKLIDEDCVRRAITCFWGGIYK